MNKIILTGRLNADPEVRYTKENVPVAHFTLAVNRAVKKEEESKADFISCVAWNGLAKVCGEYLQKGRLVAIEGKLQLRKYEKNGKQESMTEVLINNMQLLDNKFFKGGIKKEGKV